MEKIAIVGGAGTMGSRIGELLQKDSEIISIGSGDPLGQIAMADTVFLAVKPQTFLPNEQTGDEGLGNKLWPHVADNQNFVSIMAGVPIGTISRLLGTSHVVRTMPNTANSLIAWYTEDKSIDDEVLHGLFGHWGTSIRLAKEQQFDDFTAVAGSGPAFLLEVAEVMEEELQSQGFGAEQAHQIVVCTLQSTAGLAKSGDSFGTTIDSITSEGGTTAAGREKAKAHNFRGIFRGILETARRRSEVLGRR